VYHGDQICERHRIGCQHTVMARRICKWESWDPGDFRSGEVRWETARRVPVEPSPNCMAQVGALQILANTFDFPNTFRCFQTPSVLYKHFQIFPNMFRCFPAFSDVSQHFQMFHTFSACSKHFQMFPNILRCFPRFSDVSQHAQILPIIFRFSTTCSDFPQRFQIFRNIFRCPQHFQISPNPFRFYPTPSDFTQHLLAPPFFTQPLSLLGPRKLALGSVDPFGQKHH